jgi:CheY-like chemotaxis protein
MTDVLVVEDDATLRQVIELVLEARGYVVGQARHGGMALELMADSRPDIVVADLKMPVMDGYELLQRMQEDPDLRHLPVILLTGNLEAGRMAPGAAAMLVKPFEPSDLIATIERLTEKTRRPRVSS